MSHVLPALYIPHGGGPCFFMEGAEHWASLEQYLRQIAGRLPQAPEAIVIISAHWLTPQVQITCQAQPELLYDYYGFPEHTYQLKYPVSGHPLLAQKIADLLAAQGIEYQMTAERGLDHGVFVPLLLMYPEAEIPVVQISLLTSLDPNAHLELGKALAPLRKQGVLLVGSGMSFHNMRAYGHSEFTPISKIFDQWLLETMQLTGKEREESLMAWSKAPMARLCHPARAEEHLLPLLVIAGSAENSRGQRAYHDVLLETAISAFEFND